MYRTQLKFLHPKIDMYGVALDAELTALSRYRLCRICYIHKMNSDQSTTTDRQVASDNLNEAIANLSDAHSKTKSTYSAVTQAKVWG